jgi:hypothetical protein
VQIAQTLGIRTAGELREAAAAGRLREVPGIGPANEAKLLEALARTDEPRPPRGMLIHRARRLLAEIGEPLCGTPAGDPRRYRDSSERLAVVVAAAEAAPVLDAFEALPAIVSVLERAERRAYGVTVEGVPVELRVAPPGRLGTELVRATGSPEYVAALEPLPDAPDEEGVYRALQLLELGDLAGLDQLFQPALDAAADAAQLAGATRPDQVGDRRLRRADQLGGPAVRARGVGVRPGQLEQRRERVQPLGDRAVVQVLLRRYGTGEGRAWRSASASASGRIGFAT